MIATIDFEGSGLHGYPIEVGIAMWEPGASVIHIWCSLIGPIRTWIHDDALWDPEAQLIDGLRPMQVVVEDRPVQAAA